MPGDKPCREHTCPPPPMDPFPTYQTPYPRSNKDDEQNPFIQFRRFADEQFSTFFSGVPHFLGLSPPSPTSGGDHWKKEVEDIMRQRQEWEEGFRKQFEQEMEEMRQHLEKSKSDAWKSMEDAWKQHAKPDEKVEAAVATPWWTRGKAANCPALNGQEPQKNAGKCPALYDENGQPRTELDAYTGLQSGKDKEVLVFQAPVQDESKNSAKSWIPALGWDGKQKERGSTSAAAPEEPSKSGRPPGRPTTYSLWAARRMRPFDNSDETIPWLMLSPYSPIYLCNPAQSRLFKVRVQDSEGAPLQISRARFFERWYTDVDEKMATRKPWADAFEDLLSLQQTGKMVDRDNWNTWRTPSTWIHDMASRGSLGDRWGFNDEGMLVKRADPTKTTTDTSAPSREDRCARWRKNRESRRNRSAEPVPAATEKPAQEENVVIDKVTEALLPFPLFGSILSAADAIVAAVDQAAQETQAQAESSVAAPVIELESTAAPTEEHIATSSTSSTSFDYNSSATSNSRSNSVISTLTSTITRTLPDGSIETKRVLKRRFADGSEESDERVEVQYSSPEDGTSKNDSRMPSSAGTTGAKDTVTQAQSRPDTRQIHELEGSRPQMQFPRRVPIVAEDDAQPQKSQSQIQVLQQQHQIENPAAAKPVQEQEPQHSNSNNSRRRGGGWFWN